LLIVMGILSPGASSSTPNRQLHGSKALAVLRDQSSEVPMKLFLKAVSLALFLGVCAVVTADGRADHFTGLPADTLEQAAANFSEYNTRLAAILGRNELTAEDMHNIHVLTYTLENALERINAELAVLADTLEELHVASETADYEGAKKHGAAYLNTARKLVP